jgi:acyl-CoA synthetase (AMP-forming)/AMP-acid ligase II
MSLPAIELLERLRRHRYDAPDKVALVELASGRAMTWMQLDTAVGDLAQLIRNQLPAGSIVMLRCPNVPEFHVAFCALLAAGMTVFPVPHDIAEAEFIAAASAASAAAVLERDLSIRPLPHRSPGAGPALLLQSSGTTGLPKIVRREAASLDAVSSNMVEAIGINNSDRVLSCVPLCHSYGLEHGLLAPLFAGATVHLAQGFDLSIIRRELTESSITVFPAVPSIYEMLGNLPEGLSRLPSLRLAYSAGGPLPACVFAKVKEMLGICIGQLYGATEVGSVTFAHPDDPHFDPASVGRPMRGVEPRSDDTGQLLIRATSMMSGYVSERAPFTLDGFFPTGDLARIDERDNLFITGRLKLLIDVGGLKVNPLEVEQTISQHPAVSACVVVPMRLSETVYRLRAIVTPADESHPPGGEELRQFVRERLSAHKVPRIFEVRPTLPRSATGKILRHLLIESA